MKWTTELEPSCLVLDIDSDNHIIIYGNSDGDTKEIPWQIVMKCAGEEQNIIDITTTKKEAKDLAITHFFCRIQQMINAQSEKMRDLEEEIQRCENNKDDLYDINHKLREFLGL